MEDVDRRASSRGCRVHACNSLSLRSLLAGGLDVTNHRIIFIMRVLDPASVEKNRSVAVTPKWLRITCYLASHVAEALGTRGITATWQLSLLLSRPLEMPLPDGHFYRI